MFEDEEEEPYKGTYENGHWVWDNHEERLQFMSDLPPSEEGFRELSKTITRVGAFRDDVDLWEQQKFRKRLQRKTTEDDVVILQDVKDVVLFTMPISILSTRVIDFFHLHSTERFLRALILYCQYYLQITDVMNMRTLELDKKIPTKTSAKIEAKYRADLEDLRILVAKEYAVFLLGEDEYRKYHHMGTKKIMSLPKGDAVLVESLTRISVQIVWIALGRRHFNEIEVEVNRIFKSDIFNSAEHALGTNYLSKLTDQERFVLLGKCVKPKKKINTNSPLMNEVYCDRHIDFRMFGLGTTSYFGLSSRLRLLECYLTESEHNFCQLGITLGILGLPRTKFDIMLKTLKIRSSFSATRQSSLGVSRTSGAVSYKSTTSAAPSKPYPDIHLPPCEGGRESFPPDFPLEPLEMQPHNDDYRIKWLNYRAGRQKQKRKVGFNKLKKIY